MTRNHFKELAKQLTTPLADQTIALMLRAFDTYTPEQIAEFTADDKPVSFVRAIGIMVGQHAISETFLVPVKKLPNWYYADDRDGIATERHQFMNDRNALEHYRRSDCENVFNCGVNNDSQTLIWNRRLGGRRHWKEEGQK